MPERPPETPLTNLDLLDSVPGLRLADRDWRALASMRHPAKVALWLAMMRPVEELMARESFVETTRGPDGEIETRSIPVIVAWAETIARRALRGDMTAAQMIADRIEGRTGTRRDEEDPEDQRRRGDIQAVIESVVTGLVRAKLGNDSLDITPATSPYTDLDNDRQDSHTAPPISEAQRAQADEAERGERLVQTNETPEERDLSDPNDPRRPNGHG